MNAGEALHWLADNMPTWVPAAEVTWACILIGALHLYASLLGASE